MMEQKTQRSGGECAGVFGGGDGGVWAYVGSRVLEGVGRWGKGVGGRWREGGERGEWGREACLRFAGVASLELSVVILW